ncbi:MAG: transposase [Candidatus Moraniibacteriota bacterium]
MRKTTFANGEYYHIYNRGVDKREVFLDEADYERFLTCLREFNCIEAIGSLYEKYLRDKKVLVDSGGDNGGSTSIMEVEPPLSQLVEIVAYCLNPNHCHFIIKQLADDGIKKFMHRIGTAYVMYFNKKYKRSGTLFQGKFKAIHVDSNEYLLYLSAYVNRNHFIHGYEGKILEAKPPIGGLASKIFLSDWRYCSALDYLGKRKGTLCKKDEILGQFKSPQEYGEFLDANALHLKEKKEIQKYLLED